MIKKLTPYQDEALDFTKHISLAANAGSGKTFVLAKRFVEIYKNEDVDLENIVAITFTDKAAGELNRKIADEIDEQLIVVADFKAKKKLEKLRKELVLANISTIHSFCINMLKEFAPEAGIDANLSPIDQQLSNELVDLSIEETFQTVIRDTSLSNDFKYLVRIMGSKSFLKSTLQDAIKQRGNVSKIAASLYSKSKEEIAQQFKALFENESTAVLKYIIEKGISSIGFVNSAVFKNDINNKHASIISECLKEINTKPISHQLSLLFQIKKELISSTENSVRKNGYLNKGRNAFYSEIEKIEELYDEILPFAEIDVSNKSDGELAVFGMAFVKLFQKVLENYENKKKLRSYLDFEDILLFANKIIKNSEVQIFLREKFKYIMIDEYQDTNEIQYDIVMPILDELRQGNLFVVGDEKQSIYMFRDADLEVFDKTKREILNSKLVGMNLTLPHSFRMYPQLVLFTNKMFGKLFANPVKEFNEVEPSDLICTKSENDIGHVGILLADENESVLENDLVIKKIIMLMSTDETLTFGDIAILCRKRKSFNEIESSLVKYNLPYLIMGGKGFYQRQSIYDVYNYLTFLINQNNDQALFGILRSPFFNISDSKLLRISLGTEKTFYEKLIGYADNDESVKKITNVIKENINAIISLEPYLLIRKILNESGYWTVLSSKKNCEQEIANMEKLLSMSREYSNKGFKNLYDYTISLKEFIEGYEDEGQALVAENQNVIKLMTIHQSKGLEFKAVFVYGTNSKGQDDNVKSKSISISKEYGILTKVPIDGNYFSKYCLAPIAAFHNYKTKKKNYAELKRLFYVAVTRAVKYLYISASHKKYKAVNASFYQLLCDGFTNTFESNSITLSANTTFMSWQESRFEMSTKTVDLVVSIEKQIECEILSDNKPARANSIQKMKNELITSFPQHEIISATKISMYSQCPVKYELTYDIGYLPLLNLIKKQERIYEFQYDEEENDLKQYARIRGKVIHKCLSENVPQEVIKDYIERTFLAEAITEYSKLTKEIVAEINGFYRSKIFNELNISENYKNEYEVYCKDGDYFLYGIIDKLIYHGDKLIIVDYKTDTIEKEQIKIRAENYFIQLKFYSYVLSKLYQDVKTFELRLVFIKHPDEFVVITLTKNEVVLFAKQIQEAILNIHAFNYKSNLEHCKNCQYALEGNRCVKSNQV